MNHPAQCSCSKAPADESRRRVIRIATAGLAAAGLGLRAGLASAQADAGDRLTLDDEEGKPVALTPADIKPGKPVLAFPFDAAKGAVRNDSRLNKVVLMRLDEALMDAETRGRSAGGVVAYSAICTHQACEVKTWLSKEQALVCYCHSSKFLPLKGSEVAGGPAPRPLPSLPLKLDGGQLVVAGPFSAQPGGV